MPTLNYKKGIKVALFISIIDIATKNWSFPENNKTKFIF